MFVEIHCSLSYQIFLQIVLYHRSFLLALVGRALGDIFMVQLFETRMNLVTFLCFPSPAFLYVLALRALMSFCLVSIDMEFFYVIMESLLTITMTMKLVDWLVGKKPSTSS